MGFRIVRFETTPNPNALKCVLDRPITEVPKSFLSAGAAAGDPLAEPFFELGGIRNILMNGDWISVNKLDATDWAALKPRIRRVLRDLEADGDA
ncbi:MAG: NifU N-terminal domain-containing protein [bacterium]|nr:NifU N-terminal domain-containing protein [bacterium]